MTSCNDDDATAALNLLVCARDSTGCERLSALTARQHDDDDDMMATASHLAIFTFPEKKPFNVNKRQTTGLFLADRRVRETGG